MALGMPVIASNYPTYRAVIEKVSCGLCVDPESADEVANAIEWIMDHPREAAEMGERGRQAVLGEFNWKVEANKLLRLYEELLTPAQGDAPPQQAQA
jgi:glycosyltransferase involved in cell wall biosynthesis